MQRGAVKTRDMFTIPVATQGTWWNKVNREPVFFSDAEQRGFPFGSEPDGTIASNFFLVAFSDLHGGNRIEISTKLL